MTDLHRVLAEQALLLVPPDADGALNDLASTAQQFACMVLVAMGVAVERPYGCDLSVPPEAVPDRIDPSRLWIGDAALALLAVAAQAGDLSTPRVRARRSGDWVIRPADPAKSHRDILEESIASRQVPAFLSGSAADRWLESQKRLLAQVIRAEEQVEIPLPDGPLRIHPEIVAPFAALGWIDSGRWTEQAQETLWRKGIVLPSPGAVSQAVEAARRTLPADVARVVAAVGSPPDMAEIGRQALDWQVREAATRGRMPEAARARCPALGLDAMRETLVRQWPQHATRRVVSLLERRWRLSLGWDSGAPLIPLFHDRLAGAVAEGLAA